MPSIFFNYLIVVGILFALAYFIFQTVPQIVGLTKSKIINVQVISIKADYSGLERRFSYVVKFSDSGNIEESILKNYASPFVFAIGQRIDCFFLKHKLVAKTLKGQFSYLIMNTSIFLFLFISLMVAIMELGIFHNNKAVVVYGHLVSLLFFVMALVKTLQCSLLQMKILRDPVRMQGRIISFESVIDNENNYSLAPVVEFNYNGRDHRFQSGNLTFGKEMLNKQVPIIFYKTLPITAEIDSFLLRWALVFFWLLVLSISIFFVVIFFI